MFILIVIAFVFYSCNKNKCNPPTNITVESTSSSLNFDWDLDVYVDEFIIEYKEEGETEWTNRETTEYSFIFIRGLDKNKTYLFRFSSECGSDLNYSDIIITREFTGDNTNADTNTDTNTGSSLCPDTASCGCSGINKANCNTVCCKWIVGDGCYTGGGCWTHVFRGTETHSGI